MLNTSSDSYEIAQGISIIWDFALSSRSDQNDYNIILFYLKMVLVWKFGKALIFSGFIEKKINHEIMWDIAAAENIKQTI